MSVGIFVTGTDTDVGKTFVSSLLVKGLREYGIQAGYFKGVSNKAAQDAKKVCEMSGLSEDYKEMSSYNLKNNYCPHLAARIEEVNIDMQKIIFDYQKMMKKYEFLVVEGSGGVVSPIKMEGNEIILLEDIIKNLGLSTILVARSTEGTINHTVLTVEHLKRKGVSVKGIILNGYDKNNIIHLTNKEVIEKLTGIKNICTIPAIEDNKISNEIIMDLIKMMNEVR